MTRPQWDEVIHAVVPQAHNWQVRITFVLPRIMSSVLRQKQNNVFQRISTCTIY